MVDVVIVGGGHNGLVAAAYLARAGRSVLLLERRDELGGAAVSERPWPGVDARLSRYAYLVSLLPRVIVDDLGLSLRLVRRRVSSYTPDPRVGGAHGLLVDNGDAAATAASFARVTGGEGGALEAWRAFYARTARLAERVFPTLTEPLLTREEMRALVGDDETWTMLFERPLGEALRASFDDDLVAGVALTDGLIGTFADADDPKLGQNRCFLYHVIGGGTGDWDVPIGGMGAVSGALTETARAAGAELRCGAEVLHVDDGDCTVTWRDAAGDEQSVRAGHILVNAAPAELDALLGRTTAADAPRPEGAQLKVNVLLSRLPRLRDPDVAPETAFAGTFHVNETATQLRTAYEEAASGRIPSLPPCETYCHSLTDPTILGPELRAAGAQTLTLFGLHMPTRLFMEDNDTARDAALAATIRSLESVLAEPLDDVLWRAPDGTPCLEVRTPVDLERELRLPGGNIFHRDLAWPFAERDDEAGTWGVETNHPNILLCGAGARRGGGVSGIPGRNAAMAVLSRGRRG
ncbi:phytoene desaturase family protein [Baekduia sp. Peel2402]|uniref:phytoene desaturase family protein n=1 Tax=Baekduia sp. Peel2402 TaxID=3458296 RepID=UPI00403EC542